MRYDADRAPDPERWLKADEGERQLAVERYHRREKTRLPNPRLHASLHVIVENQLAGGEPEVVAALGRLRAEGLDRHDALHAIAAVLAQLMHEAMSRDAAPDLGAEYLARLRTWSAEQWRRELGEGESDLPETEW